VVALFLAATLAAVELLSRGGLALLARRGLEYRPLLADRLSAEHRALLEQHLAGRTSLFRHDAVLGWTLSPGFRSDLCTIGPDGLRRDPERPEPKAGAIRIATFGDSFTFGGDVADRFAWPELLARLDSGLDVDNFGVPAYGLDQAFLRYQQEGRVRRPQVVVIGFMSENIFRDVSVYRPFYRPTSELPFAKPRYRLEGDAALTLIENPLPHLDDYRRLLAHSAATLPELGRQDLFYRMGARAGAFDALALVRLAKLAWTGGTPPAKGIVRGGYYDAEGEAFRVTATLFTEHYEMARRDGAEPLILIYPERSDLRRWRRERTKRYEPLLQLLASRGYRVVDAMTALDAAGDLPIGRLIPSHFSPLANRLLAEHLLGQLHAFGLLGRVSPTAPAELRPAG
jgi:hypothetical protein